MATISPDALRPGHPEQREGGSVQTQIASGELVIEDKKLGKRKGFRRVDDDDDDALPEIPAVAVTSNEPVSEVVYRADGFPDIGADATVVSTAANVARLKSQLADARTAAQESGTAIGIKVGEHNPARVERIAAELLAAGQSIDVIDQYESRCKLVRRLEAAVELAGKSAQPAREAAVRRLYHVAQDALRPTYTEVQKAWVALVRAAAAHRLKCDGLVGAGFPVGNDYGRTLDELPIHPDATRQHFDRLLKRGILTPNDVVGVV